jgi:putative hydrolase of the HAD superfamily
MIKTVILDIGNVLVDFRWRKLYEEFGLEGEDLEKFADATVRHQAWIDLDQGIITTEEAKEEYVKAAPEYREYVGRIYLEMDKMLVQFDYTIPWIKELKERGYRIYILSNWSKPAYDACQDKALNFLSLVDGVVFSYKEFVIKPDKKIYDIICSRYDINPAEAVFLDDNEDNIISAREFGLNAIQFQSYEQGRRELEAILGE